MRLTLVLALALTGCAGSSSDPAPPADAGALLDVWARLDAGLAAADEGTPCAETFATYFADFGVRGVACGIAEMADPAALLARAPVAPFRTGPHLVAAQTLRLDLDADGTFGHYDPVFVRWLAAASIPERGAARTLAQPIYDRHLRRLARIYWLTRADLAGGGFPAAVPAGPLRTYAAYLDGGPVPDGMASSEGGFSVFAFTDASEALLPAIALPIGNEWEAKYEANTAYGFWLRRRADGTDALWRDGLRDLLQAFDAGWLAAQPR